MYVVAHAGLTDYSAIILCSWRIIAMPGIGGYLKCEWVMRKWLRKFIMVIQINNTLPFPICHGLWRFVAPFDQMTCPWSTVRIPVWNTNCCADRMSSGSKHQTLSVALIMGTQDKRASALGQSNLQPGLGEVMKGFNV